MSTPLELLAPAGDAAIGMAAVDHGADAVYIGAPFFSARAQANRTIDEIASLIDYAHFYRARVYVALNTILKDDEMTPALDIIRAVHDAGTDGLIVQDMGLLELDLPPIPLIASTQTNNTTPEKVKFLQEVGFQKVVLARELSLEEIAAIRARTSLELEVFVHGALCVSYSGQCYMSQYAFGRSANRGVCSQPCRHAYTLRDGDGKTVLTDKHLLSQKDMNRLDALPDLIAAGATSFKIEGRYKDVDYVKNITAAYRLALDRFIADNPAFRRASSGTCAFSFRPDPARTFNRGYTSYFLRQDREKTASLHTPKSMGQFIGTVEAVGRDFFRIRDHDLQNGDGLCFLNQKETLVGCRVDQVKEGKIYPNSMQDIGVGTEIFRNFDAAFSRALKQSARCRTIAVYMEFAQDENGVRLKVTDEDGVTAELWREVAFEAARDSVRARAAIEKQLRRAGETPFRVAEVTIHPHEPGFMALSLLNELRRQGLDLLGKERLARYERQSVPLVPNSVPYPESELDYRANVLNSLAEKFYRRHGAHISERALEQADSPSAADCTGRPVMTTRYCLRYQLGACLQSGKDKATLKQPLRIFDRGRAFRLEFRCPECRMLVIPEDGSPS